MASLMLISPLQSLDVTKQFDSSKYFVLMANVLCAIYECFILWNTVSHTKSSSDKLRNRIDIEAKINDIKPMNSLHKTKFMQSPCSLFLNFTVIVQIFADIQYHSIHLNNYLNSIG